MVSCFDCLFRFLIDWLYILIIIAFTFSSLISIAWLLYILIIIAFTCFIVPLVRFLFDMSHFFNLLFYLFLPLLSLCLIASFRNFEGLIDLGLKFNYVLPTISVFIVTSSYIEGSS